MKTNENIAQETADLLLKIGATTFRFNPPYTYTSGLRSPMYIDNRLILSFPEVRTKIIDNYITLIKEKIGIVNIDYISATATAAIPQGALIADRLELPMVYVRPTTKSYGKGGKIEGFLRKGSNVLIVEDHISTGVSVEGNIQAMREMGCKVNYCIAATTFETKKSQNLFLEHKVELITLTTGKQIVAQGLLNGLITDKEKEIVERWFKDPEDWETVK